MGASVGTARVEVPDPPRFKDNDEGDKDGARIPDETVAERLMVPENPKRLVRVIVADPEVPLRTGREMGLAERLKSCAWPTFTVMIVE